MAFVRRIGPHSEFGVDFACPSSVWFHTFAPFVIPEWHRRAVCAKSAFYTPSLYGASGASIIAHTWCSKMQCLFNLGLSTGRGRQEFTQDEVNAWQEPSDFTLLANSYMGLGVYNQRVKRVLEIRAI